MIPLVQSEKKTKVKINIQKSFLEIYYANANNHSPVPYSHLILKLLRFLVHKKEYFQLLHISLLPNLKKTFSQN